MPPAAASVSFAISPPPASSPQSPSFDETQLREALKRCPTGTIEAALRLRRTGDLEGLPLIVRGVIARYVGREYHSKLDQASGDLRLIEDLGVDSLTMLEIVMLAEEVLPISLSNDDLRDLKTVGDVQDFVARKLQR